LFEVNIKTNTIGKNGSINIIKLFNKNHLTLKVKGKTVYEVYPDDLTKGLAALVLLSFNDIEDHKILIRSEDVLRYSKIIQLSGYTPSSAKKYTEFLKPIFKPRSMSVGDPVRSNEEIHGTGVFPYQHKTELE
jgi:hypothetical protein